jgi:hypothetical protein
MSEGSLRQILVDAEAEIPALKTEDERWKHVLRFFATNARDLAESSYLGASGNGDDALEMAHDSNLLKLLNAIEETVSAFARAASRARARPRIPRSGRVTATPRLESRPPLWNGYAWSRRT